MRFVERLPWKLRNHFVDAHVTDKLYTNKNEMRNDTNDANMAYVGRKGSITRCGNAAMGMVALQEDKGRVKSMTLFASGR